MTDGVKLNPFQAAVAAIVFASTVLMGVAWLQSGTADRLQRLESEMHDAVQRLVTVESMLQVVLERLPPMGGRPAQASVDSDTASRISLRGGGQN